MRISINNAIRVDLIDFVNDAQDCSIHLAGFVHDPEIAKIKNVTLLENLQGYKYNYGHAGIYIYTYIYSKFIYIH